MDKILKHLDSNKLIRYLGSVRLILWLGAIALSMYILFLSCQCYLIEGCDLCKYGLEIIDSIAPVLVSAVILVSTLWFSNLANERANDQMTKELFTEFNTRYDELNDVLNKTMKKSLEEIEKVDKEIKTLNDYCNLCAEQYYWNEKGRIDSSIWKAWLGGMKYYYKNHLAFKQYWDEEVAKNWKSYYMDSEDDNFLK